MKKSKKLATLFAAVLMVVAIFTSAISANAAPSPVIRVRDASYGSYTITGYRSVNSSTQMSGRTKSNVKATRVATTIVVRNVDSKGNIKATGGTPDKGADNATDSGIANITSGSGNHFEWINMYFAGMYDNNLNHTASTTYVYTF